MPHHIRYVAKRSLIAGHSVDTVYTNDVLLTRLDRQRKSKQNMVFSLGGRPYTTYHRGEVFWSCRSNAVAGGAAALWREFLDSVEDGQVFYFGPYTGAADSPTDRRGVVMDSDGYTEDREVRVSPGGQDDYFIFGFKLKEAS